VKDERNVSKSLWGLAGSITEHTLTAYSMFRVITVLLANTKPVINSTMMFHSL